MYWITGIFGLALIVAPFALSYTNNPMAMWSSIVLGVAIVVVSAIKAFVRDAAKWEYWVAGILGAIVLVLSGYQVLFAPFQTK
jgi:bacteriorhodopsin